MSDSATPITLAAGALVATSGSLRGVSFRETAGVAATVKLYDNSAGSGVLLGTYGLAALGSVDPGMFNRRFSNGVFAVITGTVEGSIFT